MQVSKKQVKLAALALALGFVSLATEAFAADDKFKRTFANGVVEMSEGVLHYTPSNLGAEFHAPGSMMYMRGQEFFNEGEIAALNAAQDQMDEARKKEEEGAKEDSGRRFWATPYYSSFEGRTAVKSDVVAKCDPFKMKRTGVMGGVEKQFTARTKAGLFMGYSWVGMSQNYYVSEPCYNKDNPDHNHGYNFSNHYFSPEIDAVDLQFGGNFAHTFSNGWTVNANLLGGAQHYSWSRLASIDIDGRNISEVYQGGTTGNTLSINVEFSKTYNLDARWSLTPGAAIESAHSWIWAGRESGRTYGGAADFGVKSIPGSVKDWEPWRLDESVTLSRTTARFGASLAYTDEDWGASAKAFYGTVLGDGAKYASSSTSVDFSSEEVGAGFGKDSLSLGSGLWMALNEKKTTTLGGSYDVRMWKRATSQTVSGTLVARF